MSEIDLHTHTTASDGTLSPAELVLAAKEAGLKAVALTDHDTVDGLAEGLAQGERIGMEVIGGCELSATHGKLRMHILGLFLPPRPEKLIRTMRELVEHRHNRNRLIVEKLNSLGLEITYEEVKAIAGQGSVGRPHIAKALLDRGHVDKLQQAFDVYLSAKGKAYVPKKVLEAGDAIKLLKESGGTVILAHPCMLGMSLVELEALIRELAAYGLDGIEAYYSMHSPSKTRNYLELAHKLGLAVSGGSDFHGDPKPDIKLGTGTGELNIPYKVLDDLKGLRRAKGLA